MSWHDSEGLARLIIVTPIAYIALLLILRIGGKRMLSKMNAFDLVVTIALGSTLATILLSRDVAVTEGIAALALLIALQYIVAWLATRSSGVRRVVKSEPALLYFRGELLHDALRQENVSPDAIVAGVRKRGFADLADVAAVVLEADGSLSVVGKSADDGSAASLERLGRSGRG